MQNPSISDTNAIFPSKLHEWILCTFQDVEKSIGVRFKKTNNGP